MSRPPREIVTASYECLAQACTFGDQAPLRVGGVTGSTSTKPCSRGSSVWCGPTLRQWPAASPGCGRPRGVRGRGGGEPRSSPRAAGVGPALQAGGGGGLLFFGAPAPGGPGRRQPEAPAAPLPLRSAPPAVFRRIRQAALRLREGGDGRIGQEINGTGRVGTAFPSAPERPATALPGTPACSGRRNRRIRRTFRFLRFFCLCNSIDLVTAASRASASASFRTAVRSPCGMCTCGDHVFR